MEKNDRKKIKQKNCKNEFIQYALKMVEKGNEALKWAESHQKEEAEVYIQKLKNLKEI